MMFYGWNFASLASPHTAFISIFRKELAGAFLSVGMFIRVGMVFLNFHLSWY